ncbi:MAG: metalloregulator ArsR/SmtB family transcription factor [Sedimentisphaerales bacterium]
MPDSKKRLLFQKQAQIAQAIGHPIRLEIINFLKDGEQCVCDIAEQIGAERSNVSRHLSVMVAAGVLEHRKKGLKVIYRLKCPCILEFFKCMSGVLKQRVKDDKEILKVL